LFFGNAVVPESTKSKKMIHEWSNRYTPPWLNDIAEWMYKRWGFEVSPAQINHILRGYFGNIWTRIANIIQRVAERQGVYTGPPTPRDYRDPQFKRFVTYHPRIDTPYFRKLREQTDAARRLVGTLNGKLGYVQSGRIQKTPVEEAADRNSAEQILALEKKRNPWLYWYIARNEKTGRYQMHPEITKFWNSIYDTFATLRTIEALRQAPEDAPEHVKNDREAFRQWKRDRINAIVMGSVGVKGLQNRIRLAIANVEDTTPPKDWKVFVVQRQSLSPIRPKMMGRPKIEIRDRTHPMFRATQ